MMTRFVIAFYCFQHQWLTTISLSMKFKIPKKKQFVGYIFVKVKMGDCVGDFLLPRIFSAPCSYTLGCNLCNILPRLFERFINHAIIQSLLAKNVVS